MRGADIGNDMKQRDGLARNGLNILAATVPVIAALLIGQLATYPNLGWYTGLTKPWFTPPNWIFGPVWTTLCGLMAFACWRILQLPAWTEVRSFALTLFYLQLAFNAAWPWMFFAARDPHLGVINIVPQLSLVLTTMLVFYSLDRVAGMAMAPLALWVAYALALNTALWGLN
jgi:tryptophan-rich sensory protein